MNKLLSILLILLPSISQGQGFPKKLILTGQEKFSTFAEIGGNVEILVDSIWSQNPYMNSGSGDDLGNHTATTTLNLSGNNISNVPQISNTTSNLSLSSLGNDRQILGLASDRISLLTQTTTGANGGNIDLIPAGNVRIGTTTSNYSLPRERPLVSSFIQIESTGVGAWSPISSLFSGLYTDLDFTGTTGLSDGTDDVNDADASVTNEIITSANFDASYNLNFTEAGNSFPINISSVRDIDGTGFDGNLVPADDDIQKLAQKVDDLILGEVNVWNESGTNAYYDGTVIVGGTNTANTTSTLNVVGDTGLKILRDDGLTGIADLNRIATGDFEISGGLNRNLILKSLGNDATEGFIFNDNLDNTLMKLQKNGYLGRGIASPVTQIHSHESGAGFNYLQFTNGDTGATITDGATIGITGNEELIILNRESNDIRFDVGATRAMTIDGATGNAGIGLTDPTEKLHVDGNILGTGLIGSTVYAPGDAGDIFVNDGNGNLNYSGTLLSDLDLFDILGSDLVTKSNRGLKAEGNGTNPALDGSIRIYGGDDSNGYARKGVIEGGLIGLSLVGATKIEGALDVDEGAVLRKQTIIGQDLTVTGNTPLLVRHNPNSNRSLEIGSSGANSEFVVNSDGSTDQLSDSHINVTSSTTTKKVADRQSAGVINIAANTSDYIHLPFDKTLGASTNYQEFIFEIDGTMQTTSSSFPNDRGVANATIRVMFINNAISGTIETINEGSTDILYDIYVNNLNQPVLRVNNTANAVGFSHLRIHTKSGYTETQVPSAPKMLEANAIISDNTTETF